MKNFFPKAVVMLLLTASLLLLPHLGIPYAPLEVTASLLNPYSGVELALTPNASTVAVGQTFDVTIEVRADAEQVDGVSVHLNFDPTYLDVVSIASGSDLPLVIQNTFSNTVGTLDFAAGTFSSFPTGTFALATVTFSAKAITTGTNVQFHLSSPRRSDVTFGGQSILDSTLGNTVTIANADLVCSVTLEGRPSPPDASWSVPLTVSLTDSNNVVQQFTPTTNQSGEFTLTGILPGTYVLRVKNSHTLQTTTSNVVLNPGNNNLNCGHLREGDANDDNHVTLIDFSILVATFGKCAADAGFDARADFNEDGCVNILDFSLLATNFGQSGNLQPVRENDEQPSQSVIMQIDPDSTTVAKGDLFDVTVQAVTGEQPLDAAHVSLTFDPTLLDVEELTIDTDSLPRSLLEAVDYEAGTINIAQGTLEEFPTGTIPVLHIQFRALAESAGTTLAFQDETNSTFKGVSTLMERQDSTIVIANPTAIQMGEFESTLPSATWALLPLMLTILAGGFWLLRRRTLYT